MKILLGILQLITFVMLAVITVHAFMLQAYVAKQRKAAETRVPVRHNQAPRVSIAESWSDLDHVPIPDPLIHGLPVACARGRGHTTKTHIA